MQEDRNVLDLESLEGSNDIPLDTSLARDPALLDSPLDQTSTVLLENLEITGCKTSKQAFIISPSVGSREVQMLSRTMSYVTSKDKISLFIATIRMTDITQMLGFRDTLST